MDRRAFITGGLSAGMLWITRSKLLAEVESRSTIYVPGIIHAHSTFSDGWDSIPQRVARAKQAGATFFIATDHYDQIASRDKPPAKIGRIANPGGVDVGFSDYVRNCMEQTGSGFVCIPGYEVASRWKAESDTEDQSHTLALGAFATSSDPILDKMVGVLNTQENVIHRVNELGMLSVAAHPALISSRSATITPWEPNRFRYNRQSPDRYRGLQGIEFFNSATSEQEDEVLSWYLSLVRDRRRVFATAGCDSHGWGDRQDDERWRRMTWVKTDSISQTGILSAIRAGETCATANGVRVTQVGAIFPQSTISRKPQITLILECDTGLPDHVVIYRDGEKAASLPYKGRPSIAGTWIDHDASPGEHWYVAYVKGCLVSSPMIV